MLKLDQGQMIEKVAQRFRALGEANRVRLLILLSDGERNVTNLTAAMGLRQASVSKHLAVLRQAGLVTSRREASQVLYRVADEGVYQMCSLVCDGIVADARRESEALGLNEDSSRDSDVTKVASDATIEKQAKGAT